MKNRTMHLRDLRLLVNAGMSFPACYAGAAPLDCDKSRLATTTVHDEVTCKRCLSKLAQVQS